MRKLAVVLGALIALVVVAAVGLLLSLNRIIDANRERILQQASTALGRTVSANRISGSLRGGIGVRLDNLQIADAPGFGDLPFLKASSAMAHVAIGPLLHGELQMARVDIEQPVVTLIRDAKGHWNFESVKSPAPTTPPPTTAPAGGGSQPVSLLIVAGNIAGGRISVTDNTSQPPRRFEINALDLALGDVSAGTPIVFNLVAAVQAPTPNLRLQGQVGPLTQASFPATVRGEVGPFAGVTLEELDTSLTISPGNQIELTRLAGKLFDGELDVHGRYAFEPEQPLSLAGSLRGFDIAPLVDQLRKATEPPVFGKADLDLDLKTLLARGPLESLTGTVKFDGRDFGIRDYNLARELITRFSGMPGLGPLLSDSVKAKYARLFAKQATEIKALQGTTRVAEQQLQIDALTIETPDVGIQSKGTLAFDGRIDQNITIQLSPELSRDIIADVKEARLLQTPDGRIELPMRWRGRVDKDKPQPDAERLGSLLGGALGQKAGALIDKYLAPDSKGENRLGRDLRKLFGK